MGPRGCFYPYLYHCDYIGLLGTGFMQVLYSGRAPRTKEALPYFLKWRRVTRHPLVFHGLTGSQRIPGIEVLQGSYHCPPIKKSEVCGQLSLRIAFSLDLKLSYNRYTIGIFVNI